MSEKKNQLLGVLLAGVGAILGITLHLLFFIDWYKVLIAAQIEQFPHLTNDRVITWILPVFTDFGILAGAMYAVSAYGFFRKKPWAYALATVANVLALQFSFWPMIPAMDLGLTPVYLTIFLPNVAIYLLLHFMIGKRSPRQIVLALIAGMTFVTAWINGTACLNIYWMKDTVFHIAASRIHWATAFSFGVVTVGLLLFPKKEWFRMLALGMGLLEIVLGTPMGITTTIEKGEFSMFLAAPIFSAILIMVFLMPKVYEKMMKLNPNNEAKSWMIYE